MKILDYFEHPKFGVIVSSTDRKFDNFSDDEIKKRIGDTIFLVSNSSQKKPVKVKSIDIATSLIGKKNINICLSDSIKLSDIKPDSQLLLLSEQDDLVESKNCTKQHHKILCISDNSSFKNQIKNTLDNHFQVLFASNVTESLKLSVNQKISGVIIDLEMSPLNRYEIIKILRKSEQLKNIPLVVLAHGNIPKDQTSGFGKTSGFNKIFKYAK